MGTRKSKSHRQPSWMDVDRVSAKAKALSQVGSAAEVSAVALQGVETSPAQSAHSQTVLTRSDLNSLTEFITRLECRLVSLDWRHVSKAEKIREARFVFEKLVSRECVNQDLVLGIDRMCDLLLASDALRGLMKGLAEDLQQHQGDNQKQKEISEESVNRLVDEVKTVLDWYLKRKRLLLLAGDELSGKSGIFNLKVLHDKQYCAVSGFEVSAALRLNALEQGDLSLFYAEEQTFWLKVFVRQNGHYVKTRPCWESWQDQTDFVLSESDGFAESNSQAGRFSAILPLVGHANGLLVDDVSLFVPYQALSLQDLGQQIEVVLGLYDVCGKELLKASCPVQLAWPSSLAFLAVADCPAPSPQSLCLWSQDASSGDRILSVKALQYSSSTEEEQPAQQKLRVSVDCLLADHRDETLCLHCRLLDADGLPLHKSGAADEVFELAPLEFVPLRTYERRRDLAFEVALDDLDVKAAGQSIAIELCLCSAQDNRAFCGVVDRVRCQPFLATQEPATEESSFVPLEAGNL